MNNHASVVSIHTHAEQCKSNHRHTQWHKPKVKATESVSFINFTCNISVQASKYVKEILHIHLYPPLINSQSVRHRFL